MLVARLQGVAARYASGVEARNSAELGAEPGDPVSELRGVTVDGWLLTVAAAVFVDGDHWYAARAAGLLEQAGADLAAARVWRAAHPPRAFRPPRS